MAKREIGCIEIQQKEQEILIVYKESENIGHAIGFVENLIDAGLKAPYIHLSTEMYQKHIMNYEDRVYCFNATVDLINKRKDSCKLFNKSKKEILEGLAILWYDGYRQLTSDLKGDIFASDDMKGHIWAKGPDDPYLTYLFDDFEKIFLMMKLKELTTLDIEKAIKEGGYLND